MLVAHVANHACDRRAVYVDIEHAEENAEARLRRVSDGYSGNVGDFAVAGRDDCARILRDGTLGITKKPEKEKRQQTGEYGPGGTGQPTEQGGDCEKRDSVEVSVTNHGESSIIAAGGMQPRPWRPTSVSINKKRRCPAPV